MYEKKITLKKNSGFLAGAAFLAATAYLYIQNNSIGVTTKYISVTNLPKALEGMKIAHVSDIHLPVRESRMNAIVRSVLKERPDFIFLTGDLVETSEHIENSGLETLMKRLAIIAPSYAVPGNHEYEPFASIQEWKEILERAGVHVLVNQSAEAEYGGESFVIAGLDDNTEYKTGRIAGLDPGEKRLIFLLTHRPNHWDTLCESDAQPKPDAVFCGHAHGGLWRVPGIGGLASPQQGLFPKYSEGVHLFEDADKRISLIVSRGLGNTGLTFRVNNRPEIISAVFNAL
ncbi:MAG: metallophosphoesterase [Oscillospiraceae bacterium]|jgi:predicted MPP superfamily phosphohydrolase|nr:metallophosphoesterase [Oscillospiraceae bacterium]